MMGSGVTATIFRGRPGDLHAVSAAPAEPGGAETRVQWLWLCQVVAGYAMAEKGLHQICQHMYNLELMKACTNQAYI